MPPNHIDAVMDVAIKDGHIAQVAPNLKPADAIKTIDVHGMVVTPGLIDMHFHAYNGTGERGSYAGDLGILPDGFTFRSGVTTIVDAGSSGWRNFEDFKDRVIDRSKTRVLAMINIVGAGMRGSHYENNLFDMDGQATARMAMRYPGLIVGIKTAHYAGPEWTPVEQAVVAGTIANIPVMVDFGTDWPQRPIYDLLTQKLRPGDVYTHMYSGLRHEQDPVTHRPQQGLHRRPRARHLFRHRHRRRQFQMVAGGADDQAGVQAGFHFHRPACGQHEQRHQEHPECRQQADGDRP